MKGFDFHCHIYEGKWDLYLLSTGIDLETSKKAINYSKDNENVFCAVGIHPLSDYDFKNADKLKNLIEKDTVHAVGECGLDKKYNVDLNKQIEVFKKHMELAKEYDLPLIVHSRYAAEETLKLLKNFDGIVILHWFSGLESEIKEGLDRGYYFTIGPVILYKNARKKYEYLIKESYPDKLLLETDSPIRYMNNESNPTWIFKVAEVISEMLGDPKDKILGITYKNALDILKITH
jgi:TatD DNase family protein